MSISTKRFVCVAPADAFFALFETGKPNEDGDAASLSGKGALRANRFSINRAVFGGDRSESSVASAALSALARFDPSRAAETAARLALRAAAASARETSPEEEEEEGAAPRPASADYRRKKRKRARRLCQRPLARPLLRRLRGRLRPARPSGHFASADVAFRRAIFKLL